MNGGKFLNGGSEGGGGGGGEEGVMRQHHHVHVDHHRDVRAPVAKKVPAHRAVAKRTARRIAKAEVLHEKVKDIAATTKDPKVKAALTALVLQAHVQSKVVSRVAAGGAAGVI